MSVSQARQNHLQDLTREVDRLENLAREATMHRWDVDEKITDLNQTIQQAYIAYLDDRLKVNKENTSRQQAEKLQQIDQQWQYSRTQFEKQLSFIQKRNGSMDEAYRRFGETDR